MFDLKKMLRPHIDGIQPYSSARDDYAGSIGIFLDANENALGSATDQPYNRYPDPKQTLVKEKLATIKKTKIENIFLGNGSDEAIDLLFRMFCRPGMDNVIVLPPTYGMYEVSAGIHDVVAHKVNLSPDYQIRVPEVLQAVDENTKMIFICSPNNPTGNNIKAENILQVLADFKGIVVVDEAYIDFSGQPSYTHLLGQHPNLVVLQTFSKAWGLAGLRLGMAFASAQIIQVMNKIKSPYNINILTQELALEAMEKHGHVKEMVISIIRQREILAGKLLELKLVEKVFPSDANFLLVKMKEARKVYEYLVSQQIIVRDRSNVQLCEGSLRISVGTAEENAQLLKVLGNFDHLRFPDRGYLIA